MTFPMLWNLVKLIGVDGLVLHLADSVCLLCISQAHLFVALLPHFVALYLYVGVLHHSSSVT